ILRLAEDRNEPPRVSGPSCYMKSFNAALFNACIDRVKATYLRIGKPRSLRTPGEIFFGAGYSMSAFMQIPQTTTADT
ncbi:thiamine pyrophosphate-binding protein, partial [Pseudomonas syringae pv. tagetis]